MTDKSLFYLDSGPRPWPVLAMELDQRSSRTTTISGQIS